MLDDILQVAYERGQREEEVLEENKGPKKKFIGKIYVLKMK